jgi:predicted nucleic acid-binding protein
MNITHLIDTDVFIDLQREYQPAVEWFNILTPDSTGVPVFVALELIQDARNRAEAIASERFAHMFQFVFPSNADYSWALRHYTNAALANGTGVIDMLIASLAVSNNAVLYTFNAKHYRNIPGLAIEQPYTK